MNICYTLVQMFISDKACIMLYICTNISLVLTNIDSEEPDAGLKNLSTINHIIMKNEHLLHLYKCLYQTSH